MRRNLRATDRAKAISTAYVDTLSLFEKYRSHGTLNVADLLVGLAGLSAVADARGVCCAGGRVPSIAS